MIIIDLWVCISQISKDKNNILLNFWRCVYSPKLHQLAMRDKTTYDAVNKRQLQRLERQEQRELRHLGVVSLTAVQVLSIFMGVANNDLNGLSWETYLSNMIFFLK